MVLYYRNYTFLNHNPRLLLLLVIKYIIYILYYYYMITEKSKIETQQISFVMNNVSPNNFKLKKFYFIFINLLIFNEKFLKN